MTVGSIDLKKQKRDGELAVTLYAPQSVDLRRVSQDRGNVTCLFAVVLSAPFDSLRAVLQFDSSTLDPRSFDLEPCTPSTMLRPHLLVIITGANRGFGKAIAHAFANSSAGSASSRLSFVFVGRNTEALERVRSEFASETIQVEIVGDVQFDEIEKADEWLRRIQEAIETIRKTSPPITKAILINNAGSLGDLSQTVARYDWRDVKRFTDINIVSFSALCSSFLSHFRQRATSPDDVRPFPPSLVVVNISSLLALQPSPYWGLYSTAKVARDQLLKVIALEEANNDVKTLSYAPGPMDNDMQRDVRHTLGDAEQKELYSKMHAESKLVRMEDSAAKLVEILAADEFTSGVHIDYYD
ncbi:hypothetical protein BC937DRAFT_90126 [Endogone sp. FLAS-F59071]|nr:hypothetical protein BC937DRAFT_90126 [Endogone sp. FLAS-F59071]|eukprot:RUS22171.1 hypothetical protein BC937DRAFT_90126 [Endogone sp. FLAS-F59071]